MGMIRCERHGDTIISFVSKGVAESVLRPGEPPSVVIMRLVLDGGALHRSVHLVDAEFVSNLADRGYVEEGRNEVRGEEAVLDVFCELREVCIDCLKDWKKKWSLGP